MKAISPIAWLVALLAVVGPAGTARAAAPAAGKVIAYYDMSSGQRNIGKIHWEHLDVLNLAFIGITSDGLCAWLRADGSGIGETDINQADTVAAIIRARDAFNPSTKLVLSVGGWTQSYAFSYFASDTGRLNRLAESCTSVMEHLHLDGLDVDWEYPGKLGLNNCPPYMPACQQPSDSKSFVSLLATFRSLMPTGAVLSAAVFMDPSQPAGGYDVPAMDNYLDTWNVMAYDAVAPNWHPATAFQAGIHDSIASLEAFERAGASRSKLVLGVPFYGYVWQGVSSPALGSRATGEQSSAQYATPDLVARFATDPGCLLSSDDENGDSYFCASGRQAGAWAAVDTARVLTVKAKAVKARGYAGMMCWSVTQDKDGSLLAAMANGLR